MPRTTRIKSLLIANRGEIAIRVMRAANELGYSHRCDHSPGGSLLAAPDEGGRKLPRRRGKGPVEAYLDTTDVIRIACEAEADAIHPGYGFLSENPDFATACEDAGLIFIGPSAATMRELGNKVRARDLAVRAGVPVMPATPPLPREASETVRLASEVGFPVMLKASWGGGGRGMRVVEGEAQLAELLAAARREAQAAFGNDEVYLENSSDARGMWRCRSWGMRVATWCTSSSAIARCSVAIRKSSSGRPRCFFLRTSARHCARPPCGIGARGALPRRRHGGIPAGRGQRTVFLHRSESTHPGRAHGDRGCHRDRPGESPDLHRGRGRDRHP